MTFRNERFWVPYHGESRGEFYARGVDGARPWSVRLPLASHANPEAARLRRARIFHEAAAALGGEMNPARPRVPLAGDAEWTDAEEARQWAACFAWRDREMSYEMARDAQLGVRQ